MLINSGLYPLSGDSQFTVLSVSMTNYPVEVFLTEISVTFCCISTCQCLSQRGKIFNSIYSFIFFLGNNYFCCFEVTITSSFSSQSQYNTMSSNRYRIFQKLQMVSVVTFSSEKKRECGHSHELEKNIQPTWLSKKQYL